MTSPLSPDLVADMVRLSSTVPGFARGLWEGAVMLGALGKPDVDPALRQCLRAAVEAGHWPAGRDVVDVMMSRVGQ